MGETHVELSGEKLRRIRSNAFLSAQMCGCVTLTLLIIASVTHVIHSVCYVNLGEGNDEMF